MISKNRIEDFMKERDHITIPINWCPTRYYSIEFRGWEEFTISADDHNYIEMCNLFAKTIDSFIEMYKGERVFTEPQFGIRIEKEKPVAFVKIATLEKEEYERRVQDTNEK